MACSLVGLAPGTTELLGLARKQPLGLADMLPLRPSFGAAKQRPVFPRGAAAQAIRRPALHILANVWGRYKLRYLGALALRVAGDLMRFAGPAALEAIVGWLSEPNQARPRSERVADAFGAFECASAHE